MAARKTQNKALSTHSVLDWIETTNQEPKVPQSENMTSSVASDEQGSEKTEGYTRKTYYFRTDHVEQIAEMAYRNKAYQKDIIEAALELYFAQNAS